MYCIPGNVLYTNVNKGIEKQESDFFSQLIFVLNIFYQEIFTRFIKYWQTVAKCMQTMPSHLYFENFVRKR